MTMTVTAAYMPDFVTRKEAAEPPLWIVVAIFWAAFAVAVVSAGVVNPHLFESQDPDSFLRLVQVRDLHCRAGLVRSRPAPDGPARRRTPPLVAPDRRADRRAHSHRQHLRRAAKGSRSQLWPLLMLFAMMGSAAAIGSALGGRAAAVWSLVLALFFLDPLIVYLPGDIDHHNAQIALTMATVAFALRVGSGARFGFFAGLTSALTLAIGLEMLPHVVMIGAAMALQWAVTGKNGRAIAAYGATLAVMPADLYALAGSPAAFMACDFAVLRLHCPARCRGLRARGARAISASGSRALRPGSAGSRWSAQSRQASSCSMSPDCLGGPYGFLSPELKKVWLQTVTEAQPFQVYAAREPVGAFGSLMPLLLAVAVAVLHLRPGAGEKRSAWAVPAALLRDGNGAELLPDPHASLRKRHHHSDPRRMDRGDTRQGARENEERFRRALPGRFRLPCRVPGHLSPDRAAGGRRCSPISPTGASRRARRRSRRKNW